MDGLGVAFPGLIRNPGRCWANGWRFVAISEQSNINLMVHVDPRSADSGGSHGESVQPMMNAALRWYFEWLSQNARRVQVLLPERCRSIMEDEVFDGSRVRPIWYEHGIAPTLPRVGKRERVWLVNGNRMPMLDWTQSRSAVRRQNSDIVVLDGEDESTAARYAETVVVDDGGEVIRFQRYYDDSPAYADLSLRQASVLTMRGEHVRGVVSHVLRHGWGMDAIGGLTRHHSVRWSKSVCVPSVFGDSGPTTFASTHGPIVNDRFGQWNDQDWTDPAMVTDRVMSTMDSAATDVGTDETNEHGASPADQGYLVAKRVMDITMSALILILLSPVLLVLALLVKLTSPGAVLFAHKRQGLDGLEFYCLKFRSMAQGADRLQAKLRDQNEVDGPQFKMVCDPRLTKLGGWLRRYNLDELPQFWNVLVGQMSLVGPRPSPDGENQLCPAWRRTRLSVKPGITGLWQVLRERQCPHSDFQEWIYYDVEYARHRSLWLDIRILFYTPFSMFASRKVDKFAVRLKRQGICKGSTRGWPGGPTTS